MSAIEREREREREREGNIIRPWIRDAGELSEGDIVLVRGLTSEKGKKLNGKRGTILPLKENSTIHRDYSEDPGRALLPNGRYGVLVILGEAKVEEGPMGSKACLPTKSVQLKRENLEIVEASPQTIFANFTDRERKILADACHVRMKSGKEWVEEDPGIAGMFVAVGEGNCNRVREIMEHLRRKTGESDVADNIRDGAGDTAILGAIEKGNLELVKLLLEYGADPNVPVGSLNPSKREMDLSVLHFAIIIFLHLEEEKKKKSEDELKLRADSLEELISLLIDKGVNVNKCARGIGRPLDLLLRVKKAFLHEHRMRIMKKMLQNDADPNALSPQGMETFGEILPIVDAVIMQCAAAPEVKIDVIKLLLEYGADPGKMCKRPGESVNAIIMAANHRMPQILEILLQNSSSSSMGCACAAVNSKHITDDPCTGENPLQLVIGEGGYEKRVEMREVIVILLKYGGDIHQKRDNGVTAYDWLRGSEKHQQLRRLIHQAPKRKKHQHQHQIQQQQQQQDQATLDYWDMEKNGAVKAFVGIGSGRRCPMCLVWSDHMRDYLGGKSSEFKKCSRCRKVWYCSAKCQKQHWGYHKSVCKPLD